MKTFVLKAVLFVVVLIGFFFLILSQADGYTDPFYLRFTTPKQENLIIGTSRAAQGLQPSAFKEICNIEIYNYSFTSYDSPFGETYLNSIKNKVEKRGKNGIFIITVDPWSLSSELEKPNDYKNFRELKSCLANTKNVNKKPNFEYLLKNLKGEYFKTLFLKNKNVFLHNDGWLEVSVDMDNESIIKRTKNKMDYYRENILPKSNFSSLRLEYLQQTISFLNQYGKVYLVRLPIDSELMSIENELMPEFNTVIEKVTSTTKGYFNLTKYNNDFIYIDGNHLFKKDGKTVSKKIANWIKMNP